MDKMVIAFSAFVRVGCPLVLGRKDERSDEHQNNADDHQFDNRSHQLSPLALENLDFKQLFGNFHCNSGMSYDREILFMNPIMILAEALKLRFVRSEKFDGVWALSVKVQISKYIANPIPGDPKARMTKNMRGSQGLTPNM